jgi:glycosyl hydrolase family 43/SH3 domain-containing protein
MIRLLRFVSLSLTFALLSACGTPSKEDSTDSEPLAQSANAMTECVKLSDPLVTTANLNLRSGPGSTYSIVQVIPMGATVSPVQTCPTNGWYNVSYAGTTGWASGAYLTLGATGGVPRPRQLLVSGLADPGVLKDSDNLFFLSGTYGNTLSLPLFQSTDLQTFTLKRTYNPSAIDSRYDYCALWAPDLSKHNGVYWLYFSAYRVAKGAACPGSGVEPTTFRASAADSTLNFGVPESINAGTTYARTRPEFGCPAEGCDHVIRIDSNRFDDGTAQWLFYVWFNPTLGNTISSFRLESPAQLIQNAAPSGALEQGVNEGPFAFQRGGRYYLFLSQGSYDSKYAMSYLMSSSVADLTRARALRRHSTPVVASDGRLLENHGHNAIVERLGQYYNVFHMAEFDSTGKYTGRRSTYIQPIDFRADGSIVSLNTADVRWNALPGYSYSLDVVLRDGTWVGPCIGAGTLGTSTATTFTGVCPGANNRLVHKSDIATFRLYYSNDGTWRNFVDQAYDGGTDRVSIALPGGTTQAVALNWNEKTTGTEYSLDVQRADGTWVAPCVSVSTLGKSISYVYTGACTSASTPVPVSNVRNFRICSAINGDWAHATCGSTSYDGKQNFVDVAIP